MSGLALCRPIKPHAINSHFLMLPDRLLFIPTSCSGCVWVTERKSIWRVSPSRSCIWRTPPPNQHVFHLQVGIASAPAQQWALCLGDEDARESYWLYPLAVVPCQCQNCSIPAPHGVEKAVTQAVCTPCREARVCLGHQPQPHITAWGLHPIPEPADSLSGHVWELLALLDLQEGLV